MIPILNLFQRKNKYKNEFVIQEHLAVRAGRHFDIRLEHNGVLVSFATRKLENLLSKKSKIILLFRTPDHNLDWFTFSGEIIDEYGRGRVMIWDTGKYEPIKFEKDKIIVEFKGKKIKGKYVFIYIGSTYGKGKNQWLMKELKNKEQ